MPKQRLNNTEWLSYVADQIENAPKKLASQRSLENDFLTSFYEESEGVLTPLSNAQLYGIVGEESHTSNLFMSVLYDRVIRESIRDGLLITNKLGIFREADLTAGKVWSRLMADIMTDEWYDKDASPVTTDGGVNSSDIIKEVFSDVPVRRLVQFTIYDNGVQEAFRAEMGIQDMIDLFFKRVSDTINYRVYLTIKDILKLSSTEGNVLAPFVDIEIAQVADGYNMPIITPADGATLDLFGLDAITTAQEFKYYISSLVYDMSEPSAKYNVGDGDGAFTTSLPVGSAVFIVDPNALAGMSILEDANFTRDTEVSKLFASIIPMSNLGNIIERTRVLDGNDNPDLDENGMPDDTDVPDETRTVIAVICDPKVVEYRFMLEKSLDWANPRALYTNYFSHFWFATLCNNFLSAVRIILVDDSQN